MAQSVNVNFRMDEQLKKNVEEICQRMGMNLTTLLTICCRKVEQERRIPFDITADPDPFYSESNVRYLKGKLDVLNAGTLPLEEHDLIKVDGTWDGDAGEDYCNWQKDKATLKRINVLIKDMCRDSFDGIVKPEPLKHDLTGLGSRRINDTDRLTYKVVEDMIIILACKGHYD